MTLALKNAARQLCPPALWRFASALRRRLAPTVSRSKSKPKIGARTDIHGNIDMRAEGSAVFVGSDCLIAGSLVTETAGSVIRIGNNVFVGGGTVIDCFSHIEIGDDVLVSYSCIIADSDAHSASYSLRRNDLRQWRERKRDWSRTPTKSVRIEKGAWLGARAIVLKGVTIGEGAVVGAGSVVTRDVAPYTIVAGNPARVVRELGANER